MICRTTAAATAAALIAAIALGPALGAAAAPADTEPTSEAGATTWALQPSTADGPDGRISLRHTVAAGEVIDDLVAVTNFSQNAARFAIYASDGTITADGSFDLLPEGEQPTDGGAWITIGAVEGSTAHEGGGIVVDVPAGATTLVPVSVAVPDDATPGDHPAGVVAELLRDDDGAVQLATRVGVRVHLRVTGDLIADLVPEGVRVEYEPSWNPFAPGTMTVHFAVNNAGNVRLGADTTVVAGGLFGLGGGTTSAEAREVLPGQAVESSAVLPVWPLVFSWGEVRVAPGVVGEDANEVALKPTAAGFGVWTVPWSQLLLLVLIAGVVLALRWWRLRSRRRMQARIDAAVAAATAAAAIEGPSAAAVETVPVDQDAP